MNKKIKLITLLLTLIFCVSAMTFTAYAVDGDNSVNSVVEPEEPPVNDEPIVDSNPDYEEPTYAPEVPTESPVSSDTNSNVYSEPEYDVNSNSSYSDNNSSSNYENNYSNDNNYAPQENYQEYEDDNNSNDSQISTYSPTDMYKNSGKVDLNELSNDDWNAIAKGLANAESLDSDGGDDFNFIKKNNNSDDNGIWMLITGAVLIILSIIGLSYLIVTSIKSKRKFAYAGNNKNNSQKPGYRNTNRASNDYGDGYSNSKKALRKNKRMEDTSDIYLPKSTKNGGNHYRR